MELCKGDAGRGVQHDLPVHLARTQCSKPLPSSVASSQ